LKLTLDIFLIAAIILGFVLGYKDGFVRKLIGFIGFCAAILLSVKFSTFGGKILNSLFSIETYLSEIIAGVLIFLIVVLIFSVLKRVVHPFDKVNGLINQILGGITGVIQIMFFLSALLYLLSIFNFPSKDNPNRSFVYRTVYSIMPSAINILRDYTPDTKKIIKNYVNGKDTLK
jgi:membrane protein required for colicin V production